MRKEIVEVEVVEDMFLIFDYDEDGETILEFEMIKEGDADVKLNEPRSS